MGVSKTLERLFGGKRCPWETAVVINLFCKIPFLLHLFTAEWASPVDNDIQLSMVGLWNPTPSTGSPPVDYEGISLIIEDGRCKRDNGGDPPSDATCQKFAPKIRKAQIQIFGLFSGGNDHLQLVGLSKKHELFEQPFQYTWQVHPTKFFALRLCSSKTSYLGSYQSEKCECPSGFRKGSRDCPQRRV